MHKQQLYPSPTRAERRNRKQQRREQRRWSVEYDLLYDGGSSQWTGWYRSRATARMCAYWNVNIGSWGGSAHLIDHVYDPAPPVPKPPRGGTGISSPRGGGGK